MRGLMTGVLLSTWSPEAHAAGSQGAPVPGEPSRDSSGASASEPKNLLLVNPGDLFNGLVTLEYERGLGRFIGLSFGLSVMSFRGVFAPPVRGRIIAVAPEFGVRLHLIRSAPRGLWFGPSSSAAYLAPGLDAPTRPFGFGFGAAVGSNFTLGHFVFQLGVGGAVHDSGDGFVWSPRLRLGLGAVF
ncbi:MAG: hypothetical protein MUC96_00095 [Myxococcaceae bacterium]|nr:hypothetical protein [Myxococcaceae bacterium]